ncbi:hypothetical protein, partial [Photobacterium leiognathi]|uniref:hypothetical protein n=1 Tax=Photobacterium leiognathi TaxID=553611 RepID=UPI0029818990
YHFQQLASSSTPFHKCRTYYLKSGLIRKIQIRDWFYNNNIKLNTWTVTEKVVGNYSVFSVG